MIMTMTTFTKAIRTVSMAAVVAATAFQVGCVDPGPMDPAVVSRVVSQYQAAMVEEGPQHRNRDGDLGPYLPPTNPIVPTFTTQPPDEEGQFPKVELSLDEAVMIALANNLQVRVISYTPSVAYEKVVEAAAEFDYTVFGSYRYGRTDSWSLQGVPDIYSHQGNAEFGIRQKAVTGATWALTSSFTDVRNQTTGNVRKGFTPSVALDLRQPVLRGAGVERNLSTLRIARINHEVDLLKFRRQTTETVTEVISTYWQLVQARDVLLIQEELLTSTVATYDRVYERRELDATAVEIKQAEAAVASRRATLIIAQKYIEDTENRLAQLLADETLNAVNEIEIVPTTLPGTERVTFDVVDQLVSALRHNPILEQARLAIQASEINVRVAENEALPRLDFVGNVNFAGGGAGRSSSFDRLTDGDYVGYEVGLEFEYPLGNRQRAAQLRGSRLEYMQSVSQLQDTADQVALRVRDQIRTIDAAYDSILAQREAVAAQREQLQALEDTERIRGQLTPEFLQTKLGAQQSLAVSRRAEAESVAEYNIAVARLNQATGTTLETQRVEMSMPAVIGNVRWSPATPTEEIAPESDIDSTVMPVESGEDILAPSPVEPEMTPDGQTPLAPSEEIPAMPVENGTTRRPDFGPAGAEASTPVVDATTPRRPDMGQIPTWSSHQGMIASEE
jgi:outer membrane protein